MNNVVCVNIKHKGHLLHQITNQHHNDNEKKTEEKRSNNENNEKKNGKNERHGDNGRAKTKAETQISELEKKAENASRKDREQINRKIQNIRRDAEQKQSGEEHSRTNKR